MSGQSRNRDGSIIPAPGSPVVTVSLPHAVSVHQFPVSLLFLIAGSS